MTWSSLEGQKRIMAWTLFATYGDKAYGTKAATEIIFARAKKIFYMHVQSKNSNITMLVKMSQHHYRVIQTIMT